MLESAVTDSSTLESSAHERTVDGGKNLAWRDKVLALREAACVYAFHHSAGRTVADRETFEINA